MTVTLAEPGAESAVPSLATAVHDHSSPAWVAEPCTRGSSTPASAPSTVQLQLTASASSSASRPSRFVTAQTMAPSVRAGTGAMLTSGVPGAVLTMVTSASKTSPASSASRGVTRTDHVSPAVVLMGVSWPSSCVAPSGETKITDSVTSSPSASSVVAITLTAWSVVGSGGSKVTSITAGGVFTVTPRSMEQASWPPGVRATARRVRAPGDRGVVTRPPARQPLAQASANAMPPSSRRVSPSKKCTAARSPSSRSPPGEVTRIWAWKLCEADSVPPAGSGSSHSHSTDGAGQPARIWTRARGASRRVMAGTPGGAS